jgi:hypothetical protein
MLNNNRLQSIWTVLARSSRNNAYTSEEDIASFQRRASAEGSSYYARDLRSLRVACLAGLESGKLSLRGCRFRKRKGTALPVFLFDAFKRIFDEETGEVLGHVDAGAVSCVNILTGVFTKIKGGHPPETEAAVIESFVQTERELCNSSLSLVDSFRVDGSYYTAHGVLKKAKSLIELVLRGVSPREIMPAHGSGVSADGVPVWQRYGVPRFIKKIDEIWPMSEYYSAGYTAMCDKLGEFLNAEEDDPCARVLLVPKDVRGPRLISCEPHERMWIQQGLMELLYKTIEAHPLTRGSVNFTDQRHNQSAAYEGSTLEANGYVFIDTPVGIPICISTDGPCDPLCTLDLKDASDRLRLDVVERLFPQEWVDALTACRSEFTELPDGRIVAMSKHAPMGSAVCFPIMALCIWSLLSAVANRDVRKDILVYGDDIVVRRSAVPDAIRALEMVGFIVNRSKSFSHGFYRESCGKEYFKGYDVTPFYLRELPDDDMASRMSFISFVNNYYLWLGHDDESMVALVHEWYGLTPETANVSGAPRALLIEQGMRVVTVTSGTSIRTGCLLRDRPCNTHVRRRWNKRLNRHEYRILTTIPEEVLYPTDDWSQVLRALTKPRRHQFGADALARRVRYKWIWVPDMVSYIEE